MYTRNEAIEKVLEIKSKLGHMPTKEEYEQLKDVVKLEDLMVALDATDYAAVNITVLRELRKREGKQVYIALDRNGNGWHDRTFIANLKQAEETHECGKSKKDDTGDTDETLVAKKPKKEKKKSDKKFWSKEEVAEIVMRFYEQYGHFPKIEDFKSNGAFRNMDELTPCNRTLYRNLGKHRSMWLNACTEILSTKPSKTKP